MYPFDRYERALGQLVDSIKAAGIPYKSVFFRPANIGEMANFEPEGIPYVVEIVHEAETTAKQRGDLEKIVKQFDFRKRRVKARTALRSEVAALSERDKLDLLDELIVAKLETDPMFALRAGKGVDGDENALLIR